MGHEVTTGCGLACHCAELELGDMACMKLKVAGGVQELWEAFTRGSHAGQASGTKHRLKLPYRSAHLAPQNADSEGELPADAYCNTAAGIPGKGGDGGPGGRQHGAPARGPALGRPTKGGAPALGCHPHRQPHRRPPGSLCARVSCLFPDMHR